MKLKFKLIAAILVFQSFALFAQKDPGGGLHLSYNANFNRFFLTKHSMVGTASETKRELRSPEIIPDEYLATYQFGFINHNKSWHDFRFLFQYMPKTTKSYKEYKDEGLDWQTFDNPNDYVSVDMEMYLINMSHLFKINIAAHHLYLNLGFGGGGGVIRWPSANEEGSDYYFLTYYGYPVGGIEILLGKHIGINSEYRYQWGKSGTQAATENGNKVKWGYQLLGHELSLGLNFYF